jgi:hypothetical protein
MKVVVEKDPSTADLWLIGRSVGHAVLGLQLPHGDSSTLALTWRGYMPRRQVQQLLYQVQNAFSKASGQYMLGRLYGYGTSKKVVGPVANGLYEYLSEAAPFGNYDAYRAEFWGSSGRLTFWANVKEGAGTQNLDEAIDNIGVSTSLTLFEGQARPLIAEAIEKTKEIKRQTVLSWLAGLSNEIHRLRDGEAQQQSAR